MQSSFQWMIVRVKPRFEKKFETILQELTPNDEPHSEGFLRPASSPQQFPAGGSEVLPYIMATALTFTTTHKWSDRIKKVELPAINGYVFFHFAEGLNASCIIRLLTKIHYTPGFLYLLTHPGQSSFSPEGLATVSDFDLQVLQAAAQQSGNSLQPSEPEEPTITKGKLVRFREGPLAELGVQFRVDDMRRNEPTLFISKGIFMNARFTVSKEKLELVDTDK